MTTENEQEEGDTPNEDNLREYRGDVDWIVYTIVSAILFSIDWRLGVISFVAFFIWVGISVTRFLRERRRR